MRHPLRHCRCPSSGMGRYGGFGEGRNERGGGPGDPWTDQSMVRPLAGFAGFAGFADSGGLLADAAQIAAMRALWAAGGSGVEERDVSPSTWALIPDLLRRGLVHGKMGQARGQHAVQYNVSITLAGIMAMRWAGMPEVAHLFDATGRYIYASRNAGAGRY